MQKSNPQFSQPLIIFTVISMGIFWGISINYDNLRLPLTEASLLTRLYQPRQTRIGGSR
jgi:hypothetical protein